MKTILLPTDFSDNAWNATKYALSMFDNQTCHFILMHSYYIAASATDYASAGFYESILSESETSLKQLKKRIQTELNPDNATFETVCEYGAVELVVQKIVEEKGVDLIVMGTQGASGITEILFGSNTAKVINNVKCAVITVPGEVVFQPPATIVLAADYKEVEDDKVFQPLQEIAGRFDSNVMVVNVLKEGEVTVGVEEALQGWILSDQLGNVSHTFHTHNNNDPEEGINAFAHENKADMIAMVKRDHPFFERLFSRSITKKMAYHTDVPLLVMHE